MTREDQSHAFVFQRIAQEQSLDVFLMATCRLTTPTPAVYTTTEVGKRFPRRMMPFFLCSRRMLVFVCFFIAFFVAALLTLSGVSIDIAAEQRTLSLSMGLPNWVICIVYKRHDHNLGGPVRKASHRIHRHQQSTPCLFMEADVSIRSKR